MSDRLRKTIEREVESFVDRLIAEAVARGDDEIPVIGGPWYENDPDFDARQTVVRALLAREQFKTECPGWGQPLPISQDEISNLYSKPDRRLHLVAEYAHRLRSLDWHPERTEPFCLFCLEYGRAMEMKNTRRGSKSFHP